MSGKPVEHTPAVPGHAELRWLERGGDFGLSVTEAWRESVPVGIPDGCDIGPRAMLHPPTGTLLVYAPAAERGRRFVVRTVLRADLVIEEHGLNTDHLAECGDCGLFYDPSETDNCPWHGVDR